MGMFSQDGDGGEKTEAPTGRRIGQARTQGSVGQSPELSQVIGMFAAFYAITSIVPWMWQDIQMIFKGAFTSRYGHEPFSIPVLRTQFFGLLLLIMPKLMLILLISAFFGAGCTLIQTNFLLALNLLKPKFSMLNPVTGLKRIFSINGLMNFAKQFAKLLIIGPIAYTAYFRLVPKFLGMMDLPIQALLPLTAEMASGVFFKIMQWLLVLAILDYFWKRWRHKKQMLMSKQEVKDDSKASEGDAGTKRRILMMGLQRARDRMMKNVPKADVVVTNPTHIAVALSYSAQAGAAPRVVAKGQGHVAARIREIAKRNGVPIVERKPLARALFKSVEVGHEIPYELFKAVAEILAYVYRVKGRNPLKAKAKTKQKPVSPQASR